MKIIMLFVSYPDPPMSSTRQLSRKKDNNIEFSKGHAVAEIGRRTNLRETDTRTKTLLRQVTRYTNSLQLQYSIRRKCYGCYFLYVIPFVQRAIRTLKILYDFGNCRMLCPKTFLQKKNKLNRFVVKITRSFAPLEIANKISRV